MPSPLGPKVKRPAPPTTPADAWRPVPGKPHLYVDAQGRMKYAPPTPSASSPMPWPNYAAALARLAAAFDAATARVADALAERQQ